MSREMTMICRNGNGNYDLIPLIAGNLIIISTILLMVVFLISFSRKLQYFLIKERAPLLALGQTFIFLMTILVPYVVELIGYTNHEWTDIDIGRKMAKAIYVVSRELSYIVFVLR